MMNNQLGNVFKYTEILMRELEEERDESIENLRFEGEEEILVQYYKKILTSIYRMRNNAAALLLRNNCSCKETEESIVLLVDGVYCQVNKSALKNILQKDYDNIVFTNLKLELKDVINEETTIKQIDKMIPIKKEPVKENKEQIEKNIDDFDINLFEEEIEIQTPQRKEEQIKSSMIEKQESDEILDMNLFNFDEIDNTKPVLEEKKEPVKTDELDIPLFDDFDFFDTNENNLKDNKANEEIKTKEPEKELEEEFDFFNEQDNNMKENDEKTYDDLLDIPLFDTEEKEEINKVDNKEEIDTDFDLDFDIFGEKIEKEEPVIPKPKKQEEVIESPFKINPFSEEEPEEIVEEETIQSRFTTEMTSDDPEDILNKLKQNRKEYDRLQVEKQIQEEQDKNKLSGEIFDLTSGKVKEGTIDIKEASGKIDKVAESLVNVSRKDKLLDLQIDEGIKKGYTYQIQKNSDYERNREAFIFDMYRIKIKILEDNESIIREDIANLMVVPIDIPESGTKLVTDICAYLECNGEQYGTVVLPGGKSTLAIRCDDYIVLIKGSWDNGNFISTISVIGNGNKIEFNSDKKEIRPKTMDGIGIGHNILILDHATVVHIIPIGFKNTKYGYAPFIGVISRDYGIDKDAECKIYKEDGSILVVGERYKFNINCFWDNTKFIVDSRIQKN